VGFDQLDAWFTLGVVGFVNEVFAVDVHAPIGECLAFFKRKPPGDLAEPSGRGRPQRFFNHAGDRKFGKNWAEAGFRKVRGHEDLPLLTEAISALGATRSIRF
jgi:hypothetical protein